eukprot:m51a1_g14587 hypothetical protein (607) ;mRNA; f:1136679-1139014
MSETVRPIIIVSADGTEVARCRPNPPPNARDVLVAKFSGAGSLKDPEGFEVFSQSHVLVPGTYVHVPPAAPHGRADVVMEPAGITVLPRYAARRVSEARQDLGPAVPVSNEGVWRAMYLTNRRETCEDLLAMAKAGGAFLIRAPPLSGKTGLTQLFTDFLREPGVLAPPALIVRASLSYSHAGVMSQVTAASEGIITSDTIENPPDGHRIVLIVDEAQIGYRYPADTFWAALKKLNERAKKDTLSVLVFAAYGEKAEGLHLASEACTPMAFDLGHQRGPAFVSLRISEYDELVEDFNRTCQERSLNVSIRPAVAAIIREYTGRHTGLTAELLLRIEDKFHRHAEPATDAEITTFIYSAFVLQALQATRAVETVEGEKRDALVKILLSATRSVAAFNPKDYTPLIRDGIVFTSDGHFLFSSPLLEKIYVVSLLSGIVPSTPIPIKDARDPEEFENFVVAVLTHMRASVMRRCLAVCADLLPNERTWQMEFYLALTGLLPAPHLIHPDFPAANKDITGFVDFYINGGVKWAIELLCQGNERNEHSERFITGAYALIDLNQRLVIDFVVTKRFVKIPPNTWIVVFDNTSFQKAKIHLGGDRTRQISLVE